MTYINDKSTKVISVTDGNFDDEVIRSDVPVLVDFWAEWCGPCKVIGPMIEELANDYQGKVKFAKLNVDNSPESARRFGVRSIPTLMLFRDGELQQSSVGVQPKRQLVELIEQYFTRV